MYNLLDAHPEISMVKPVRPEPKFFLKDDDYLKGVDYYIQKYFSEIPSEVKALGEKSTSYLEYAYLAKRIYEFFPQSKILVILRNPVDRAISNFNFSVQNGLETRTLTEVFLDNRPTPTTSKLTSVSAFAYVERGKYAKFITPYLIFSNQVQILILEELLKFPFLIREVYNFLQVDGDFTPATLNDRFNESEDYSESWKDLSSIRAKLSIYYQPHILAVEKIIGRQITLWHD